MQQLMQGMNQAFATATGSRMSVDTSVSPVQRPDNNNSSGGTTMTTGSDGVQAWKQMWDSASKSMFQQQHQLLQRAATGQDAKFNNSMNNTANLPIQPAKRKFAEMNQSVSVDTALVHP